MSVETYRELSVILLLLVKYYKYIKLIIIKLSPGYLEDIDKIALIDIWYFLNIFLEMSCITLYLSNYRKLLVPVPGSRDLGSVVYGRLKEQYLSVMRWRHGALQLRFLWTFIVFLFYFSIEV